MLNILKALIVVAGSSVIVLAFFRKPFADLIGDRRYVAWGVIWLVATVLTFLVGNFWIFCALLAAIALAAGVNEPLKPAVFALLFLVAPPATTFVPGFAGINKFIDISPQLVLVLLFLTPLMFLSAQSRKDVKPGGAADFFIIAYLIFGAVLAFREVSFTHTLRVAINGFLLVGPVYFIASRHPKTLEDIRIMTAAFLLPVLILSSVAFLEFAIKWHFYNEASGHWGLDMVRRYKFREGFLRAYASTENSVSWGVIVMCAFGVALAYFNDRTSSFYRLAGLGLLGVGLLVSMSRGPWLGGAVALFIFVLFSRNAITRLTQLGVLGIVAFGAAAVSPFGQTVIGLLPFVGDSASETITYRQQLLSVSMDVFRESPWIGHLEYRDHPDLEVLRQGEGIIDIVNTYANVALSRGLIGLVLFLGCSLTAARALYKAMRRARTHSPEIELYARGYLAATVALILVIFTTSSLNPVNFLYWFMLGSAVAIARVEERAFAKSGSTAESSIQEAPESTEHEAFAWK